MAWIRSSLGLMALGFVIDRFGLVFKQLLPSAGIPPYSRSFSFWMGASFVCPAWNIDGACCVGTVLSFFPLLSRRTRRRTAPWGHGRRGVHHGPCGAGCRYCYFSRHRDGLTGSGSPAEIIVRRGRSLAGIRLSDLVSKK